MPSETFDVLSQCALIAILIYFQFETTGQNYEGNIYIPGAVLHAGSLTKLM